MDESGKPEIFSAKGINLVEKGHASKYLILSAVRTKDQLELQQQVTDFKSKLLKDDSLKSYFSSSYSLDNFHASNDFPEIRKRFCEFITTLNVKIDVMAVEKLKCYPNLQNSPGRLYGFMAGQLLKDICHKAEHTEIVFSRKDSKLKLRNELEIEVERVRLNYINNHENINNDFKLSYYHNPHYTHGGLQVADYISFAVFKVFENNNYELFDIIQNKIGWIRDVCNKKYFTRRNPLKLST
ncbi:MAG: DUF3800 domain-containing protein [Actinobacteria bacterium]|nr:DUF3800 domain-containing protein [Actinomycetota bacterium]